MTTVDSRTLSSSQKTPNQSLWFSPSSWVYANTDCRDCAPHWCVSRTTERVDSGPASLTFHPVLSHPCSLHQFVPFWLKCSPPCGHTTFSLSAGGRLGGLRLWAVVTTLLWTVLHELPCGPRSGLYIPGKVTVGPCGNLLAPETARLFQVTVPLYSPTVGGLWFLHILASACHLPFRVQLSPGLQGVAVYLTAVWICNSSPCFLDPCAQHQRHTCP